MQHITFIGLASPMRSHVAGRAGEGCLFDACLTQTNPDLTSRLQRVARLTLIISPYESQRESCDQKAECSRRKGFNPHTLHLPHSLTFPHPIPSPFQRVMFDHATCPHAANMQVDVQQNDYTARVTTPRRNTSRTILDCLGCRIWVRQVSWVRQVPDTAKLEACKALRVSTDRCATVVGWLVWERRPACFELTPNCSLIPRSSPTASRCLISLLDSCL